MPQRREPWMWVVRDGVVNTVDLVLITEPWPFRDQVLHVDEISVCNHSNTGGDVEVGLVQGGNFFALDTIFNLVANTWRYGHGHFTFLSRWRLYARFIYEADGNGDPCVNGDDCELHVVGYVLEPYSTP